MKCNKDEAWLHEMASPKTQLGASVSELEQRSSRLSSKVARACIESYKDFRYKSSLGDVADATANATVDTTAYAAI